MTRRSLFFALFLAPSIAVAQQASDTPAPDAASIRESAASVQQEMAATQALIEAMQKRLEGLNTAGDNRDQELEFLQSKIGEAIRQIAGERRDTQNLQQRSAETEAELQALNKARDELNALASGKDVTITDLRDQIASLSNLLTAERQTTVLLKDERQNASDRLQALEGRSEALEAELAAVDARHQQAIAARDRTIAELKASISQDTRSLDFALEDITVKDQRIASLEQRSADQERRIAAQAEDLSTTLGEVKALTRELAVLRDRMAVATADLERERLNLAARQADLGAAQTRLADGKTELEAARARLAEREAELAVARNQLATREAEFGDQRTRIADLDRKLAAALAQEVSELRRYRSEFFGRLRAALGDRPDIRIVGDRFVLQAEVLFASGSAEIDTGGNATLNQLAVTLRQVTAHIPPDVDWILRIDGHTDRIPISTGRFPSNWELSATRAISVLRFLAGQGVPAERLGAMGFGEYQPLDPREDEIAYRRNRRIEFKLTQR